MPRGEKAEKRQQIVFGEKKLVFYYLKLKVSVKSSFKNPEM